MNSTYYIFPIHEIERIILDYLDEITDWKKLILVNKYFYNLISDDPTYLEIKNFCRIKKSIDVFCIPGNTNRDTLNLWKACQMGYLRVMKYLLMKYSNRDMIQVHYFREFAFQLCCRGGHTEPAKWLYEFTRFNKKSVIDIRQDNNYAFNSSCENGHIETAKWLYELSKTDNRIDIHSEDESVFRFSCVYGRLELAKWLYKISYTDENKLIDIRARNDHAFRTSCRSNTIEIAKWLCSLCPDYKVRIENDSSLFFIGMKQIT